MKHSLLKDEEGWSGLRLRKLGKPAGLGRLIKLGKEARKVKLFPSPIPNVNEAVNGYWWRGDCAAELLSMGEDAASISCHPCWGGPFNDTASFESPRSYK